MVFYLFAFFVFSGRHLENSSFTCMGAQLWRTQSVILRFFVFFETAKKQDFARLAFSRFFIICGAFWEAFWVSFGVLLESLSSLWRAGVMRSVAFGLPQRSVGFLCYFLCCLWLVRAVFGLGDRSGTVFCAILRQFWDHFGVIF